MFTVYLYTKFHTLCSLICYLLLWNWNLNENSAWSLQCYYFAFYRQDYLKKLHISLNIQDLALFHIQEIQRCFHLVLIFSHFMDELMSWVGWALVMRVPSESSTRSKFIIYTVNRAWWGGTPPFFCTPMHM